MSELPEHKKAPSLARRHVLKIAAAGASRVAAVAALSSLPIAAGSLSPAKAHHTAQCDPHCFLRGTHILTSKGEVCIEDLRIGDLVVTARGEAMPIKWLARNFFKKTGTGPWQKGVQPIRVSRFALDGQTPHADLYLSPAHALYIDGVLINVRDLVNNRSITPAMPEGMNCVEYFHIELETHEVIFAEGAAAESYGGANRENFTNFVEYERLYGTEPRSAMTLYAPNVSYTGGRSELKALLRLAVSPVVDMRDQCQVAYSRIAERAAELVG